MGRGNIPSINQEGMNVEGQGNYHRLRRSFGGYAYWFRPRFHIPLDNTYVIMQMITYVLF